LGGVPHRGAPLASGAGSAVFSSVMASGTVEDAANVGGCAQLGRHGRRKRNLGSSYSRAGLS